MAMDNSGQRDVNSTHVSIINGTSLSQGPQLRYLDLNGRVQTKAATNKDLQQLWVWNEEVPTSIGRCVHEIVKQVTDTQPNSPALCAWDGEATYGELDRLATGLAGRLTKLDVGTDMIVPLLFEKSIWTTVAMLGVLKCGAAFVLLDPSIPEQRLQSVIEQTKANVAICSQSTKDLGSRMVSQVVTLSSHVASTLQEEPGPPPCTSNPSSVMYVAFTSGSTGTPKGAVITHQNLASALHHQQTSLKYTTDSRVYDFCSYSFDVFICNAFATLSSGGCICVPNENDRRDRLAESIASLSANVIDLTPSVARLLSPDQVPSIKTIIFGGEALHLRDVMPWWGKVQIISLYGPCECTPNSTINCSPKTPGEVTRMGKGVGLVTWVADVDNHDLLAPVGCVGELLLEGPLVGSGYLDDKDKTTEAFIEDPVWLIKGTDNHPGRRGRLYKTGDLVRYNEDGSLTFVGRKDSQVKIRGQRIELGDIEHALCSHKGVDDAVAVVQQDGKQEPWIAGFVTVRDTDISLDAMQLEVEEGAHIQEWENQFNGDYTTLNNMASDSFGRDFMGWTSMYNGSDINKAEMNEWLDDTIHSILNGGQSGHVLEIGTGSGMILFNLADQALESYVGLEPSAKAVEFITQAVRTVPALADKVRMFKATASDIGQIRCTVSPNLVVLNSVIQYFPNQAYLFNVVQEIAHLSGVRTIFFGDVRSHVLHKEFLVARSLHITGGKATKSEIRRMVSDMERVEAELLVDPVFFTTLPARLPEHIEHVEILPKKMHANNELSAFRYEAVIHIKSQSRPMQQTREIGQSEWVDFVGYGLDRQSLLDLLQRSPTTETIGISNIPNSKFLFERRAVQFLQEDKEDAVDDHSWLSIARQRAQTSIALSAIDLTEIAAQAGCRVDISWARQFSQHGGLDAIFHHLDPVGGENRVMFRFPHDVNDRPYHSLCSEPLRQQLRQKTQDQVFELVKAKLPPYMVPQIITVLDKMPLNDNGKIDRRKLASTFQSRITKSGPADEPGSEAELEMRKIWGNILNIEPAKIGQSDNFFHLGGNSIAAMRLVSEAREAGFELTVANIFHQPDLQNMARQACALV